MELTAITKEKPRKIKIAAHYRSAHPRLCIKPKLILGGNWLEAAGFEPGMVVNIAVTNGMLVITPV